MPLLVRRLLFAFFVTLFLVSAPLIVLYTAGYRYNIAHGGIVRTGVLDINTIPRNVSVILDGMDQEKNTPEVLKYLLPDAYSLSLEREGYHTWSGEVDVYSGETTFVQDILLFRDETPELLFETSASFVAASPDQTLVAYVVVDQGWSEVWLLDVETNEQLQVDRFVTSPTENLFLAWSANGGFLLVENSVASDIRVYENSSDQAELEAELLEDVQTAFWHPTDDNLLYLATSEELIQYDLQTRDSKSFDDANVATVLLDASTLTFVDNGTQVELRQIIDDEYTVLAILPQASYRVAERDGSFVIILDDRSNLFIVDIHAQQPILLQTSYTSYDWLERDDELVYTDGFELNTYNPHAHSFRFITRQGVPIDGVAWHASGRSLLVDTDNQLLAIEKEKQADERVTTTLASNVAMETFWTSRDGKFAYFYGTVEDVQGLYTLRLTR